MHAFRTYIIANLSDLRVPNSTSFGKDIGQSSAYNGFQIWKIEAKFCTFCPPPVKSRGGVGEMFESVFRARSRTEPLINL